MKVSVPAKIFEVTKTQLWVGDYLSIWRIFNSEDVKKFAEASQDPCAAHLHGNDGAFFVKGLVYGQLVTSIFTA